ncbi:helix-turn-helix domain-containing protein [Paraburkholderia heleia]|uniref:hypothetical protein n=1 Tax=Paraburkholderia heleia TaxID=634127 RepID=UPI002AB7EC0A|nr:hypothetical protein [Paraburkholderia heleia]
MTTPTSARELLLGIKTRSQLCEVEIGRRLGISQSTVNRVLNGKSDCKASTLLAIQQWHHELQMPPGTLAEQEEGV